MTADRLSEGISRRGLMIGGGALLAGAVVPRPALALPPVLPAEDGYDLWLRYRPVEDRGLLAEYRRAITHLVAPGGTNGVLGSAVGELRDGLSAMLGRPIPVETRPRGDGAVIVGTAQAGLSVEHVRRPRPRHSGRRAICCAGAGRPDTTASRSPAADRPVRCSARSTCSGSCRRGAACTGSTCAIIRRTHCGSSTTGTTWTGTVERGYAGPSIFDWEGAAAVCSSATPTTPARWPRSASTAPSSTTSTPTRSSCPAR